MKPTKPLIVLTGPTAVGKTKLSIALAKAVGGEIISADSMQVYKGMDIGSAKIFPDEMGGVTHHLIDILDPKDDFNVMTFKNLCNQIIPGIYERGHIPILVGGTGFYIQAVLKNVDFTENPEGDAYRQELEALLQEKGAEYLHQQLTAIDPVSAQIIHANNSKRVIRALEFYHMNHYPISEHNQSEMEKASPYNYCYFVLNDDRDKLYDRIEKRIDKMMDDGLIEEVQRLKEQGCMRGMTSMQGLGYKEILDYLNGELTLEEAVYILKRDTRHFAKRQLTWFRRESDVIWVNKPDFDYDDDSILSFMMKHLNEKEIL